jgi:hypothetical protein
LNAVVCGQLLPFLLNSILVIFVVLFLDLFKFFLLFLLFFFLLFLFVTATGINLLLFSCFFILNLLLLASVLFLNTSQALKGEDIGAENLKLVNVTLQVVARDITCHL